MFLVLVMVMMLALVLQLLTETLGMMILLMIDLMRLVFHLPDEIFDDGDDANIAISRLNKHAVSRLRLL